MHPSVAIALGPNESLAVLGRGEVEVVLRQFNYSLVVCALDVAFLINWPQPGGCGLSEGGLSGGGGLFGGLFA